MDNTAKATPLNGEAKQSRLRRVSEDLTLAISEGQADPEAFAKAMEQFGEMVLENARQGGGGGGGDIKPIVKRNTWIVALVAALFGGGGIVTTIYLNKDHVAENREAIEDHAELPMHKSTVEKVGEIEGDIAGVQRDVGELKTGQGEIKMGLEKLTTEAKTKEEAARERYIEKLERQLKEERRRR